MDEEVEKALAGIRADLEKLRPLTPREVLGLFWRVLTWPQRCVTEEWRCASELKRGCMFVGGFFLVWFLALWVLLPPAK